MATKKVMSLKADGDTIEIVSKHNWTVREVMAACEVLLHIAATQSGMGFEATMENILANVVSDQHKIKKERS